MIAALAVRGGPGVAAMLVQPVQSMKDVDIKHHFGGGVYIKETRFPAGAEVLQHRHEYEHLAYLVRGRVEVVVDGKRSCFTGPCALTIGAGKHHGVRSKTDTVWLCIHATDCTDADQVDEIIIAPVDGAQLHDVVQTLAATKEE